MNFSVVAAIHHSNRAIGSTDNKIPWSCIEDMRFFRKLTMHTEDPNKVNAIIMGSTTWTSMGSKPLPNRLNVILSRKMAWMERSVPENVIVCSSIDEALHKLSSYSLVE
jgi:dihydrofolate reductase